MFSLVQFYFWPLLADRVTWEFNGAYNVPLIRFCNRSRLLHRFLSIEPIIVLANYTVQGFFRFNVEFWIEAIYWMIKFLRYWGMRVSLCFLCTGSHMRTSSSKLQRDKVPPRCYPRVYMTIFSHDENSFPRVTYNIWKVSIVNATVFAQLKRISDIDIVNYREERYN